VYSALPSSRQIREAFAGEFDGSFGEILPAVRDLMVTYRMYDDGLRQLLDHASTAEVWNDAAAQLADAACDLPRLILEVDQEIARVLLPVPVSRTAAVHTETVGSVYAKMARLWVSAGVDDERDTEAQAAYKHMLRVGDALDLYCADLVAGRRCMPSAQWTPSEHVEGLTT
jgi:hypothetical protein